MEILAARPGPLWSKGTMETDPARPGQSPWSVEAAAGHQAKLVSAVLPSGARFITATVALNTVRVIRTAPMADRLLEIMVTLLLEDRRDADEKVLRRCTAIILSADWKNPVTQSFQILARLERADQTC